MQQYKNYWVSGWATPFSCYARGDMMTVKPNRHTIAVKQFEPREEFPTKEAAAAHGLMLAKAWVDQKEELQIQQNWTGVKSLPFTLRGEKGKRRVANIKI